MAKPDRKSVLLLGYSGYGKALSGVDQAIRGLVATLPSEYQVDIPVPSWEKGELQYQVERLRSDTFDRIDAAVHQRMQAHPLNRTGTALPIPNYFLSDRGLLHPYLDHTWNEQTDSKETPATSDPIDSTSTNPTIRSSAVDSSVAKKLEKRTDEQDMAIRGQARIPLKTWIKKHTKSLTDSIAADKKYDIIHAHDWTSFPAAEQVTAKHGGQLIAHFHSIEADRQPPEKQHNAIRKIEKRALKKATKVLTVSHYAKEQLRKYYGLRKKETTVLYNRIQEKRKHSIEKKQTYFGNKHKKTILFLGRVSAQKGPYVLLDTAKTYLQYDQHVVFKVVGDGPLLRHLMMEVRNHGLSAYFEFKPAIPHDQVHDEFLEADILFAPSVSEPFSMVMMEAVLAGLPIVCSEQVGFLELMPWALHTDYRDSDQLAEYLYALIHYPALREDLLARMSSTLPDLFKKEVSLHRIYEML